MWQRRQTIYLLLVSICLLALQALPVMFFNDPTSTATNISGLQGMPREMYCALILDPNTPEYTIGSVTLLAVISVATAIISFVTIFMYKNRRQQMRNCRIGQLLLLLWGIVCAWIAIKENKDSVSAQFALCLPVVSLLLLQMAYKGIKHDEDLVRSADRLR